MRVAVVGANGQLGTELCRRLADQAVPWTRAEADLTDEATVRQLVNSSKVDLVINTAAYNKVDLAEDEPELAYRVNALGPRGLAKACASRGIPLVHLSTDYVFGLDTQLHVPLQETDPPGPLSAYGASKLAGEWFVRVHCPQSYVIRTCGLYGHAGRHGAGKGNFVETVLKLAATRPELRVVNDQHCTPTSVVDLAQAILELIATGRYGVYHATNSGETTWAELASEIFRLEQLRNLVIPIPSAEYPTKARRPAYSVLNCDKLADAIGRQLPDWRTALAQYLREREADLASSS